MKIYIRKCFLLILTISSITIVNCKAKKVDTPEKAINTVSYYELILKGSNSNHGVQEVLIVETNEQLLELMSQINRTRKPGLELPEVDFKNEVLIFAYGGQRSTGGYNVEVSEVRDEKKALHFTFKLIKPALNGVVSMSLTTPFKVFKILRNDKKITASF